VGTFTLWNEPNESGYVTPQWHAHVPVSADWYRALVRAAYPAIKRASPGVTVLIGNTSSTGSAPQSGNGGVPPLTFIRRLACVNGALAPIETGACANFRMVPADGYAQHPYERSAAPWVASPAGAGDAQMGDLPALQALLDRLVAMHRLAPGAASLWLTEQGYASNDQLGGPWSQGTQADFNADSEYLAWEDPQAVSFSQFLLRDTLTAETLTLRAKTGNDAATVKGTWTTGLEREDGTPKLALATFRTPVVARFVSLEPSIGTPFGGLLHPVWEKVEVWGRVRPGRAPTPIIVEADDSLLGFWRTVATTTTDANGIFDVDVIVNRSVPTSIRFSWLNRPTGWQTSLETKPVAMDSPNPSSG
jgi:hypothetical protein